MPAPPPESEPAMVTAMAFIRHSPRKPPDGAQLARRGFWVRMHRQCGNHRDTIGTCLDHRRRIARIDPRDAADPQLATACTQCRTELAQTGGADRRVRIVLRDRRINATDADVVDELDRRR